VPLLQRALARQQRNWTTGRIYGWFEPESAICFAPSGFLLIMGEALDFLVAIMITAARMATPARAPMMMPIRAPVASPPPPPPGASVWDTLDTAVTLRSPAPFCFSQVCAVVFVAKSWFIELATVDAWDLGDVTPMLITVLAAARVTCTLDSETFVALASAFVRGETKGWTSSVSAATVTLTVFVTGGGDGPEGAGQASEKSYVSLKSGYGGFPRSLGMLICPKGMKQSVSTATRSLPSSVNENGPGPFLHLVQAASVHEPSLCGVHDVSSSHGKCLATQGQVPVALHPVQSGRSLAQSCVVAAGMSFATGPASPAHKLRSTLILKASIEPLRASSSLAVSWKISA